MDGRAKAAEIRHDERVHGAWMAALFYRTDKRLKLGNFLIAGRKSQQSADELIAKFEALAARGKASVRQIN